MISATGLLNGLGRWGKSQLVCEEWVETLHPTPILYSKAEADEKLSPIIGNNLFCTGNRTVLLVAGLLMADFKVPSCPQAAEQRE